MASIISSVLLALIMVALLRGNDGTWLAVDAICLFSLSRVSVRVFASLENFLKYRVWRYEYTSDLLLCGLNSYSNFAMAVVTLSNFPSIDGW